MEPSHNFNMDENGFMIGLLGRSKRSFEKNINNWGEVTATVKDILRELLTVIACICACDTALSPTPFSCQMFEL